MSNESNLFSADLHMHSCLSPCAENEMTPNNLVNMAYLKGLNIIALSDHNSALNLPAVAPICAARGVLLIPAIEVETREEVHVVTYLPTIEAALELGKVIDEALLDLPYDARIFGEQLILDEDDEQTGTYSKLLTQSSALSIEEVSSICNDLGGVAVPAHINRERNSIIFTLGFIPPHLNYKTVEIYSSVSIPAGVDLTKYNVLHSSDAHCLENIKESSAAMKLRLEELSVSCFLDNIRS